jgi:EpsD family peptidyl-prolyl cis-trans isomerase
MVREPVRAFGKIVAAAGLCGALSACGGGETGKASQVAVKVNKDEVTVLQVNEQLARLPEGVTPEQVEPATRRVLSSLVNQQLLVQQAIEHKLDRDPQVLGALEGARLNILAQAYTQRVIAPQAKPSEQEIKNYYADNPDLFAERKIFRLQELTFEATPEQFKGIQATAAASHSLKQFADYLHSQSIAFSADSGVRAAEQLPLAQLPSISQLKSGKLLVYATTPNRWSAVEVVASESQPVDDKKAAPVIERYLTNRKREELAVAEVKRLRDAAKIEYVGDFSKYASDAAPAQAGAKPSGAAAAAADQATEQNKGIAALR